jgi:hypothetical protein
VVRLRGSVHRFIWEPGKVSFRSEGLEAWGIRSILQEHAHHYLVLLLDRLNAYNVVYLLECTLVIVRKRE